MTESDYIMCSTCGKAAVACKCETLTLFTEDDFTRCWMHKKPFDQHGYCPDCAKGRPFVYAGQLSLGLT